MARSCLGQPLAWWLGTFGAALVGFVAGLIAITFIILRTRWFGSGDPFTPAAADVVLSFLQAAAGALLAAIFAASIGTEFARDCTQSRALPILSVSQLVAAAIAALGTFVFVDSPWYLLFGIGMMAACTSLATWRFRAREP